MSRKMSEKQKVFCEYYCGECKGNAAQAALKAGYSKSHSYANAYKLLEKLDVQEYIKQLNNEVRDKRIASIEDVQSFWTEIMNDSEQGMDARLQASVLLAKCKGMFFD